MNSVSFDIHSVPPNLPGAEKLSELDRKKLWGSAREMEALFNGYVLADLGKKLPGTSESLGSGVYAGFFKDALAHQLASGQHNGIAKMLYSDLTKAALRTAAAPDSKSST